MIWHNWDITLWRAFTHAISSRSREGVWKLPLLRQPPCCQHRPSMYSTGYGFLVGESDHFSRICLLLRHGRDKHALGTLCEYGINPCNKKKEGKEGEKNLKWLLMWAHCSELYFPCGRLNAQTSLYAFYFFPFHMTILFRMTSCQMSVKSGQVMLRLGNC